MDCMDGLHGLHGWTAWTAWMDCMDCMDCSTLQAEDARGHPPLTTTIESTPLLVPTPEHPSAPIAYCSRTSPSVQVSRPAPSAPPPHTQHHPRGPTTFSRSGAPAVLEVGRPAPWQRVLPIPEPPPLSFVLRASPFVWVGRPASLCQASVVLRADAGQLWPHAALHHQVTQQRGARSLVRARPGEELEEEDAVGIAAARRAGRCGLWGVWPCWAGLGSAGWGYEAEERTMQKAGRSLSEPRRAYPCQRPRRAYPCQRPGEHTPARDQDGHTPARDQDGHTPARDQDGHRASVDKNRHAVDL
eukprot:364036-Chlamydomonas_euryale.AAC.8